MLVLDTTARSLIIKLAGAVAANQLEFSANYADQTASAFTPGLNINATNNTLEVTLVAAPAASTYRQVKTITVNNKDTAAATVIIEFADGATRRRVLYESLAANATLILDGARLVNGLQGVMFDTAQPSDIGTAAAGTQVIAARRDHVHNIPTGPGRILVNALTISPAQIIADQNDYTPTGWATALHVRLSCDATPRTITGFAAGVAGEIKVLSNVGAVPLILMRETVTSAVANRIATAAGDICLEPGGLLLLQYDGTTARWRVGGQHQAVPHFLAQAAGQSVLTGTWTKITFSTEVYDPMGWFDAVTNYRFTPKMAGLYLVTCRNGFNALGDQKEFDLALYKNGVAHRFIIFLNGAAALVVTSFTTLVYMNGTTDYLEQYVYHDHGVARDALSGASTTEFSAVYVGALMA